MGLILGQDSTFSEGSWERCSPRTVLEAPGLHRSQGSQGKRWSLNIIPQFCPFISLFMKDQKHSLIVHDEFVRAGVQC